MKKILLTFTAMLFTVCIFVSQAQALADFKNATEAGGTLRIVGGRAFTVISDTKGMLLNQNKKIDESILSQRYNFDEAKNWSDALKTDRWAKWQEAVDKAALFVRKTANKDEKLLKPLDDVLNANNNLMNTLKTIYNGYALPAIKAKKFTPEQKQAISDLTSKLFRENNKLLSQAQDTLKNTQFKKYLGLSLDTEKMGARDVINTLATIIKNASLRAQMDAMRTHMVDALQAHYNALNPL